MHTWWHIVYLSKRIFEIFSPILAENFLFFPDFPDWKKSSKFSLISLIGGNPDPPNVLFCTNIFDIQYVVVNFHISVFHFLRLVTHMYLSIQLTCDTLRKHFADFSSKAERLACFSDSTACLGNAHRASSPSFTWSWKSQTWTIEKGFQKVFICYRPQTKLQEGNVFTPVCHSVHRGVWLPTMPWGRQPPHRHTHTLSIGRSPSEGRPSLRRQTPPPPPPQRYGQLVGSTHHTGMHTYLLVKSELCRVKDSTKCTHGSHFSGLTKFPDFSSICS